MVASGLESLQQTGGVCGDPTTFGVENLAIVDDFGQRSLNGPTIVGLEVDIGAKLTHELHFGAPAPSLTNSHLYKFIWNNLLNSCFIDCEDSDRHYKNSP